MPQHSVEERIGTVVGRKVRLERVLGEGGMGVVCEASHVATGRKVAVKLLHAELLRVGVAVERFLDEARAAASIRHPNVVDVLDLDKTDDGVPFIVMELLHGETLRARLEREGPLSAEDAWRLLGPAMDAVAAAHEAGIVHRDLKPENLFVDSPGDGTETVKVLDFGIAKLGSLRRTATGAQLGTAHYMSPEQARGQDVGPWSDVWAMGVVWFEALTGRLPFDFPPGATEASVLAHVLSTPPARLSGADIAKDVPPKLAAAIDQALRPSRTERHADMAAFAASLERCFDEGKRMPATRERRRVAKTAPMEPRSAPPARSGGCGGVLMAIGVVALLAAAFALAAAGVTCVGCLAVLGSRPDIRSECAFDRGLCTFRNEGARAGSRCVRMMARAGDRRWLSTRACSGTLGPGDEHTTHFTIVPAAHDACDDRDHCDLIQVLSPRATESMRFARACPIVTWPDGTGDQFGAMVPGAPYEVLGHRGDWYLVRDGELGWTECPAE